VRCIVCKKERLNENEGRTIDGSWAEDYNITRKFWNKWVCCWNCYAKLPKKQTKFKVIFEIGEKEVENEM
jgi:hypothetical protein